jgi:hypothetical protein
MNQNYPKSHCGKLCYHVNGSTNIREMYAEGDMTLAKITKICDLTEDRVREIFTTPEEINYQISSD